MKKCLFLCFSVLMLSRIAYCETGSVTLDDLEKVFYPGDNLEYLEDPEGNMTINDVVKADFEATEGKLVNLGLNNKYYWLRFKAETKLLNTQWMLFLQNNVSEDVLFYSRQNDFWNIQKSGIQYPLAERSLAYHQPVFKFTNEAFSEGSFFYIRIKNNGIPVQVQFMSEQKFYKRKSARWMSFGLFLGILFFIALNSILSAFSSRRDLHVYYFFVIVSYTLFGLSTEGYWAYANVMPQLTSQLSFACVFAIVALSSWYCNKFFDTEKYSKGAQKIFYALSIIFTVLALMVFIFKDDVFWLQVSQVGGVIGLITNCVLGFKIWKKGNLIAPYVLIAYSFYFLFALLEVLHLNAGLRYFYQIPYLNIATVTDVIVLAFGLSRKFELEKKAIEVQRKKAQGALLKSTHEKQKLVAEQNKVLEKRVSERTQELQERNRKVLMQNSELEVQREEILRQKNIVDSKNKQLETFQQRISQSIGAARHIQSAIMPAAHVLDLFFSESFVLNKPKDIVSGDFWWMAEQNGKIYIAAVDCTGHGVPGAFMTLISHTLLNNAVQMYEISDPALILECVDEEIKQLFKNQDQETLSSGMDLSILALERLENGNYQACFSGAKRPLVHIKPGKENADIYEGVRRSVGSRNRRAIQFETTKILIKKGECAYLFSDGYSDQNNSNRKRIGSQNFYQKLSEISVLIMSEQKQALNQNLIDHMQGTEQRDDILVMGIRF